MDRKEERKSRRDVSCETTEERVTPHFISDENRMERMKKCSSHFSVALIKSPILNCPSFYILL